MSATCDPRPSRVAGGGAPRSSRIGHSGSDVARDQPACSALAIERIVVGEDRVCCDVVLAPDAPRATTPALAAHVRAAFPDLPRHACVNGVGDTFGAVMDRTSLPHMLEHLVVDLQTRAAARPDVAYVGVTRWTDESAGRAHIEVSFTDDLVALRAFRDAARFLNDAVIICSA